MVLIPVIICRIHFKIIIFVQFLHIYLFIFTKIYISLYVVSPISSNAKCLQTHLLIKDFHQQVASTYSAFFGQVQDMAFLPRGDEFISAAEVVRRNSTDKGIMVWDFRSTAILSNQIYQVCQ